MYLIQQNNPNKATKAINDNGRTTLSALVVGLGGGEALGEGELLGAEDEGEGGKTR